MKDLLEKLLLASLAALAPIQAIIISVGILILADMVTGILAARKRGEKISSAAMRRTVSKMFVYQMVVISGFLLEKYILGSIVPVSKIVAGVIGMVEFKSMLENVNKITGIDILSDLMKKIGSKNDVEPPSEPKK
jgi:hypothetical protein